MEAMALPKVTEEEKLVRAAELETATQYAIEVPLRVMKTTLESMEIIRAMAANGNPNSVSDAGVGALCARSAVIGAYLNVKINSSGLRDASFREKVLKEAEIIKKSAIKIEEEILLTVEQKMG